MKECQAKSSAGGETVSEPKAPLQSGIDDVWSKKFRETPGGSLEVFNLGVWTSVPGVAADYIESIRSQQAAVRERTIEECAKITLVHQDGFRREDFTAREVALRVGATTVIIDALRSLLPSSQCSIEEPRSGDEVSQFGKTSPDTAIIKESDWDDNSY